MPKNALDFINDLWLNWLIWLINVANDFWRAFLITTVVSFVLMVVFGISWENSGQTAEERKKLFNVFSKIFFAVCAVTTILFLFSIAVIFILSLY